LLLRGGLERQDGRGIAVIAHGLPRREAVVFCRLLLLVPDVREPIAGRRPFTFGDLEEHLLNLFGDWSTTTLAHRDAVDGTNGRDFRSGSGEEDFVRNVQRSALDGPLFNRKTELLTDL